MELVVEKWKGNGYKKWGYFRNLKDDINLKNILKYKKISFFNYLTFQIQSQKF